MSDKTSAQLPSPETLKDIQEKVNELKQPNTEELERLTQVGTALGEQTKANQDPLDLHAQFFFMYSPRLRNTLNLMSKKALARLVFSLVQHPLNDKEMKLREKIEQDAFHIADQMLTSKYFMILGTYMEEAQKHVDKPTESVVQSDNTVKEENNG